MTKGKIGVQMMMLKGKVEEIGVYETMRRIYDLGYRTVEVSQIPMTEENVAALKQASADFGIDIAALTAAVEPMVPGAGGETLTDDFDKIVQDCKTLDCRFLRIGMMPLASMETKESVMAFIEKAEAFAERLAEQGISLYYHTHHIEFQKHDGDYLLDIIKNNTTRLGFELDVHWIQRGGANPVDIIRQYAGRVSLLHLKDYRIGSLKMPDDMKDFFTSFANLIEFAEVGEGNLDFPPMIQAGLESGVEYFFVEQDDTYGRDPFDSLKISADHLRKLGYGDWF
ncbi:sugar phosphate isomerase/epimerase family protein [Domibacillus enclensis]|uniref:Sugar phosphate isomerase n=1 Tax=Domibacillus enclensis TaxID=1017273 RepID=A0A1N6RGE5_9BACI|nr:sugar phosphate isomerase/epimerase [Domibacillus enclensis]OXS79054.1 sugar phosphate isomerase [Domibacillus enclensis]SIQ27940.1 Sugar phosphate isomerase/epimerase [Domibacillus enclensis]